MTEIQEPFKMDYVTCSMINPTSKVRRGVSLLILWLSNSGQEGQFCKDSSLGEKNSSQQLRMLIGLKYDSNICSKNLEIVHQSYKT